MVANTAFSYQMLTTLLIGLEYHRLPTYRRKNPASSGRLMSVPAFAGYEARRDYIGGSRRFRVTDQVAIAGEGRRPELGEDARYVDAGRVGARAD
jgi:hypothetical protein